MIVDQTAFRAALLAPDVQHPDGLSDGEGNVAGRRFDVYRNNVAVSLTEALETAFPVLVKLVGADNFKLLAGGFLRQHPPSSPLMMFYGTEMPSFLEAFEPTRSIGYLPDLARLEIALRESYHAADATPIDPAQLQAMPPDALMAARITLAPALRLIRSPWPIHAVWRFNMEPGAPKPEMAAQDVLIVRPEFDPMPRLLPPGAGALLAALKRNDPLGSAIDAATAETADFDLAATLGLLIETGAMTKIGD